MTPAPARAPATVHLLHGLPGCGKTRFAQQLQAERGAVLLSHDEWVHRLCGFRPTPAQLAQVREPVHDMLWRTAHRLVQVGTDVVLDHGFWTRQARDAARERVRAMGAACRLYVFDAPADVAWQRVHHRNALAPADSVYLDEAAFRHFAAAVEPVMPDEAGVPVNPA